MSTAQQIIKQLNLQPHPEGGCYRRTYLQSQENASSIYYLLEHGDKSHWHTLQSDEILFFHGGQPLAVYIIINNQLQTHVLGNDIVAGQQAQLIIPANSILAMAIHSDQEDSYTLLSCVVSPQFKFDEFKLYSKQEMLEQYQHIDKKLLIEFSIN